MELLEATFTPGLVPPPPHREERNDIRSHWKKSACRRNLKDTKYNCGHWGMLHPPQTYIITRCNRSWVVAYLTTLGMSVQCC